MAIERSMFDIRIGRSGVCPLCLSNCKKTVDQDGATVYVCRECYSGEQRGFAVFDLSMNLIGFCKWAIYE